MSQVSIAVQSALNMPAPTGLCNRLNCGGIAGWRVILRTWAKGEKDRRDDNGLVLLLPLYVCDACRKKTVITDIVTNQSWRKIVRQLRAEGKADPERAHLELHFEPLVAGRA